ncbi:MAG: PIN domain-containing protein [Saprospiraceae bacterium]|nr:PIN domain-containing protein [Saprospiraceae bacterium]
MTYLLDTNILLIYIRQNSTLSWIDHNYNPLGAGNIPVISVVTAGEIRSIALRNSWGKKKYQQLETLLNQLVVADINAEDVIERYAEIDAFSQGRLKGKQLGFSSRNMGKNDLWIAATAAVIGAVLLTADADFDHLEGVYIKLAKIVVQD